MDYEKLRYLMYKKDIRKADVIRDTGISRPTLVNWEHGRSVPTLRTLQVLADYFGVPVSYFIDK